MLFNEPKLLKLVVVRDQLQFGACFSALQRAEIAESFPNLWRSAPNAGFSALQRAEIAETRTTRALGL